MINNRLIFPITHTYPIPCVGCGNGTAILYCIGVYKVVGIYIYRCISTSGIRGITLDITIYLRGAGKSKNPNAFVGRALIV